MITPAVTMTANKIICDTRFGHFRGSFVLQYSPETTRCHTDLAMNCIILLSHVADNIQHRLTVSHQCQGIYCCCVCRHPSSLSTEYERGKSLASTLLLATIPRTTSPCCCLFSWYTDHARMPVEILAILALSNALEQE